MAKFRALLKLETAQECLVQIQIGKLGDPLQSFLQLWATHIFFFKLHQLNKNIPAFFLQQTSSLHHNFILSSKYNYLYIQQHTQVLSLLAKLFEHLQSLIMLLFILYNINHVYFSQLQILLRSWKMAQPISSLSVGIEILEESMMMSRLIRVIEENFILYLVVIQYRGIVIEFKVSVRGVYYNKISPTNNKMQQEDQYEHSSECQDYVDYGPDGYHPVYLGEKFNGRYVIVQKLGWGHFSTVWLANDTKDGQHCALKIQRSKDNHSESALDELELCKGVMKHQNNQNWHEYIKKLATEHPNILPHPQLIRPLTLMDNFAHHGIHGKHYCSVFELLGPNLLDVIQHYQFKDQRMPLWLVKKITIDVLLGLQYLHDFCSIIHTDLKPENIMVKMTAEEQKQFVEKVKQYKVKPISMKYLKNLQTSKNSKARKKNEKKKLKKKLKKQKEANQQQDEVNEESEKLQKKQSVPEDNSQQVSHPQNLTQIKPIQICEEKGPQQQISEAKQICEIEEKKQKHEITIQKVQNKQQINKKEYDLRFLKWKNVQIELTTDLFFKIVDMGNACFTHHHYTQDIQTRQYRSPQVLLGYSYGPKTDIWSLGCTVFEMLTNNFLFKPKKISGISKDEDHLYRIIQVLGPMSKEYSLSGIHSAKFFNKKGKLLNGHPKQHVRLNQLLHEDYDYSLQDAVEIEQFLLPMLEINEQKRFSARQCLENQWLWK